MLGMVAAAIMGLNIAFTPFLIGILGLLFLLFHLASDWLAKQDASESQVQGCRRLGLVDRSNSNMSDQFSSIHSGRDDTADSSDCKVKALFVYPIKSCGIIELQETDIVATGLRYDRQFCFAQLHTTEEEKAEEDVEVNTQWNHTWRFITQRKFAQLSQIRTELWLPDALSSGYSPDLEWVKSNGCLVCKFPFTPDWEWTGLLEIKTLQKIWSIIKAKLSAKSMSVEPIMTFRLPLQPNSARLKNYTRETLEIWKDSPEAINVTSEIPKETLAQLKYFLGLSNPLGLFMADPLKRRDVFRNAPKKEEVGYQPGTGFADAYPLSIMGLSSVHSVSSKIQGKNRDNLSALRFRANIYVTGGPPFIEDSWKLIQMGKLNYHVSCRTTRCELPNVDPESGVRDKQEPLRTLKKTRANVDKGAGANPCLGMQMVPLLKDEMGSERLKVGDQVRVLETGEHFYVRMFQGGEKVLST